MDYRHKVMVCEDELEAQFAELVVADIVGEGEMFSRDGLTVVHVCEHSNCFLPQSNTMGQLVREIGRLYRAAVRPLIARVRAPTAPVGVPQASDPPPAPPRGPKLAVDCQSVELADKIVKLVRRGEANEITEVAIWRDGTAVMTACTDLKCEADHGFPIRLIWQTAQMLPDDFNKYFELTCK